MTTENLSSDSSQAACRLLYCTAGTVEEAEQIGRILVAERRAACVNILPQMQSIYRWQGKIEAATEAVLLVKTTAAQVPGVISRIETLHSYETPAILSLPIETGAAGYLNWLVQESTPEQPGHSC